MNLSAFNILVIIAFIMAVLALIKPTWPFLAVGLLLLCVAMLVGK